MNKQSGFTLIELVIVIIVLGILSAVAIPKYIDMKSDAYQSSIMAVAGAINSANDLVYSKAAIDGVEDVDILDASEIDPEYAGATLVYGNMQADDATLKTFIDGLDDDESWVLTANGDVNMRIHPANHPTIGDGPGNCFVQYSQQWTRRIGLTYPAKTTLYIDDC